MKWNNEKGIDTTTSTHEIFEIFPNCLKMFQVCLKLWQILWQSFRFFTILSYSLNFFQILWILSRFLKMLWDSSRFVWNAFKCFWNVQDFPEFFNTLSAQVLRTNYSVLKAETYKIQTWYMQLLFVYLEFSRTNLFVCGMSGFSTHSYILNMWWPAQNQNQTKK